MGLFGKKSKIPGIDVAALERIRSESEAKQRNILTGLRPGLAPISTQFRTDREAISRRIPAETEGTLEQYKTDLSGVGEREKAAGNLAAQNFREQQFRNVPEIQRSIRESLGGSGLLQSGAAASTLARPIIEAGTAARDFESGLNVNQLQNEARRQEGFAGTGFEARSKAMSDRLGLDQGTIDYLTSIGREDLIREGEGLLGIEQQAGADRLGIEQARQANEIARAQAAAQKRGNILSGLTQIGGAGIGALFGGPTGAAIGGQIGGTVGQFATGSPVQFDPTLLYALGQRNRTNTIRALGGGRSFNPNANPYGSRGIPV